MNKKEYLHKIEKELNKYELDNYYDLLYQARDVINQVDEDNIMEILGTPEVYVQELFEMNEMNPEEIKIKKIEKTAKIGIIASILFIAFAVLIYNTDFLFDSFILQTISGIILFFIGFGTFVNMIKRQSSVYTMTLVFIIIWYGFSEFVLVQMVVLLIFVFGCVNLFENIRGRLMRKKVVKQDKSFYSESYSSDETLKVKMSFGAKNVNLSDRVKKLKLKSNFGETTVNAANITHDLVIDINGSFGKVNILLPNDAYVVDNCSVIFGATSQSTRNGNGPVVTINGKFSFGEIEY